jgi:hypothetical protein
VCSRLPRVASVDHFLSPIVGSSPIRKVHICIYYRDEHSTTVYIPRHDPRGSLSKPAPLHIHMHRELRSMTLTIVYIPRHDPRGSYSAAQSVSRATTRSVRIILRCTECTESHDAIQEDHAPVYRVHRDSRSMTFTVVYVPRYDVILKRLSSTNAPQHHNVLRAKPKFEPSSLWIARLT